MNFELNIFITTDSYPQNVSGCLYSFYQKDLINAVSASLIRAPSGSARDDPVRQLLLKKATHISNFDAEFVLKVAYCSLY